MSRVLRCSLTSCFSISFQIFLDRYNVRTLTCQMLNCIYFMFLSEKSVYRLLQRHRCRRGTCSGRLRCADMELLSLLQFSFCDVYMTSCIYIVFDTSCTASLVFFASEPFRGFSCTSP